MTFSFMIFNSLLYSFTSFSNFSLFIYYSWLYLIISLFKVFMSDIFSIYLQFVITSFNWIISSFFSASWLLILNIILLFSFSKFLIELFNLDISLFFVINSQLLEYYSLKHIFNINKKFFVSFLLIRMLY